MANLYKATILLGNRDLDGGDVPTPFYWGSLISLEPKNKDGNAVENPASMMLYNARAIASYLETAETISVLTVVLKARAISGLYDVVGFVDHEGNPDKDIAGILKALKTELDALGEPPVVEAKASTISRGDASKRSRERRSARAKGTAATASMVEEKAPLG